MTAKQLLQARHEVRQCHRCPHHHNALPAEIVGNKAEVAFIIPGPTHNELRSQRLAQERGMKYLRALVGQFIEPQAMAWIPVKGCTGKVEECRSHLEDQLYAMDNLHGVVLVGKEGLNAWRPDQTLNNCSGRIFQMLNRWWCIPIDHPEAVTQGFIGRDEYRDKIGLVTDLLIDDWPEDDTQFMMMKCPVRGCGFDVTWRDPDEVGYCEKHRATKGGQWRKTRKAFDTWKAISQQPRLSI